MNRKTAGGTRKAASVKSSPPTGTPAPAGSDEKPSDLDHLGELPHSYGLDTIFLVAQEPHWLFTYWDIDISRHPGGQSFLRVLEGEDATAIESEIEVPFETRNWYIPVKVAGACYTVEIGYYRGGLWNVIARSATIQTPPDQLSASSRFDFATIPLHLSFQKLMDNVRGAVHSGETFTEAVSRLQKEGRLAAFAPGIFPELFGAQRIVLEALLGPDLIDELSSGSFSSGEIEERVRKALEEKLSSEGASELLARGQWGAEESSLFSALSALAGAAGGPVPSSGAGWTPAALSSWAAATLTSWSTGAHAQSSWGAGSLASWFQAAQSSWTQAALSSWTQAAVTSWAESAASSWSGASETLSSPGFQRKFFLHVNAEVIFYGGTDPLAKVTIDGQPVTLNPDGTFRHHFVFPDGTYEIPIVATSPDGVETRSATLRLERQTGRQGDVGHTAQPPLGSPMGGR